MTVKLNVEEGKVVTLKCLGSNVQQVVDELRNSALFYNEDSISCVRDDMFVDVSRRSLKESLPGATIDLTADENIAVEDVPAMVYELLKDEPVKVLLKQFQYMMLTKDSITYKFDSVSIELAEYIESVHGTLPTLTTDIDGEQITVKPDVALEIKDQLAGTRLCWITYEMLTEILNIVDDLSAEFDYFKPLEP